MSLAKDYTFILIGGPAHGVRHVVSISPVEPFPKKLTVSKITDANSLTADASPADMSLYEEYRVKSFEYEGSMWYFGVHQELSDKLALPIAHHEARVEMREHSSIAQGDAQNS